MVDCIEKQVLSQNQPVSMSLIHEFYGIHIHDTRYRNKWTSRLQSQFPDKLLFVSICKTTSEVVISKDGINSQTLLNSPHIIIKEAAEFLCSDILDYASNMLKKDWPPYIEDLRAEGTQSPPLVTLFLNRLLDSSEHSESNTVKRLVEAYSADVIHGVTRGKVVTVKRFLLGLGLHNLTGQQKPVQILNRLGHCIEYDAACEIETAHAEAAQQQYNDTSTVHSFAFQEVSQVSHLESRKTRVEKTGKRSLSSTNTEGTLKRDHVPWIPLAQVKRTT